MVLIFALVKWFQSKAAQGDTVPVDAKFFVLSIAKYTLAVAAMIAFEICHPAIL